MQRSSVRRRSSAAPLAPCALALVTMLGVAGVGVSGCDGGAGDASDAGTIGDDASAVGDGAPVDGDPQPGPDAAGPRRAVVTGTGSSGLNLRSAPDASAMVLGVLPDGTVVEVTGGPMGDWWPVSVNGMTGWVHGDFLTFLMPPSGDGHDFLLPWTGGLAFTVTQGHDTGSHVGLSTWAWDFGMAIGTPVRTAHDGTVRLARGDSRTGGCDSAFSPDANYVVVDRGDGLESVYLHLDRVSVSVGQGVQRGDVVGLSGETGWSCGAHLHFQIQKSPAGGGGQTRHNQTVQEFFHDTGQPLDPPAGTRPVSANAR